MKITIHHKAHWEWVFPAQGEKVGENEPVMPLHPGAPHIVKVKRLQNDVRTTVMEIPDEAVARMQSDQAKGGALTRAHLHKSISRHVSDVIAYHHSPEDTWIKIECDDKALEKYLNAVHVSGKDGQEEVNAQ